MKRRENGFTLIEILVVISIIAGLTAMSMIIYPIAMKRKAITETEARLGAIDSALAQLRSNLLLGVYPSADPLLLTGINGENLGKALGMPNDTNVGIETVFVALNLASHDVRVDLDRDEVLENTDHDSMSKNPTDSHSLELFEYVDAWGNPFAYFSHRDYKRYQKFQKYTVATEGGEVEGEIVNAVPWKDSKTGQYLRAGKFQLFSAGPDGIYNNDDDIKNW